MWTLGRFLPLVVGDLVPRNNQYWNNYLIHLQIMEILFAPKLTPDDCGYLESLISDHHYAFKQLYPGVQIT